MKPFKFRNEIGYPEILSFLTLAFSIYTLSKVEKINGPQYNSVEVTRGQLGFVSKNVYQLSDTTKKDSCRIFTVTYLISNIGNNPLTLNQIRSYNNEYLNVLYLKPNGTSQTDSMKLNYYPTDLAGDSLRHFFETAPAPSNISRVNRNFFKLKISPGETVSVNIVGVLPYAVINKVNSLPLSEGSYWGYFDFLFSTKINRIVALKLNPYFLERDDLTPYEVYW